MKELHSLCSKCLRKEIEVKRDCILHICFLFVSLLSIISSSSLLEACFSQWTGLHSRQKQIIPHTTKPYTYIHQGMQVTSAMTRDLKDSKAILPIRINVIEERCMQALSKTHSLNAQRNRRGTEDGEARESTLGLSNKGNASFSEQISILKCLSSFFQKTDFSILYLWGCKQHLDSSKASSDDDIDKNEVRSKESSQ